MKYLQYIWIVVAVVFTQCTTSSLPSVRVDYDKDADFSAYKTFNWSGEIDKQGDKHPILDNSLVRKRIKNAIASELEGRGYELSENPDLLVNFHMIIEEKTGYTTIPSYSYWRRDDIRPYNYKEGMLIIDLVDRRKNQLVWQGYTGGIAHQNPEKMEERIRSAISLIFQQYRHRAGA